MREARDGGFLQYRDCLCIGNKRDMIQSRPKATLLLLMSEQCFRFVEQLGRNETLWMCPVWRDMRSRLESLQPSAPQAVPERRGTCVNETVKVNVLGFEG